MQPMGCRLLTPGSEYYDSNSHTQCNIVKNEDSEIMDPFIKHALRLSYLHTIQLNFHTVC